VTRIISKSAPTPFLDAFLDMLVAERGVSVHTLDAYRLDIGQAAAFCARRKIDLAGAEAAHVTQYMKALSSLAPKSRARKLSSLRQYYRFLVSEGRRKDDPTAEQESPRLSKTLPDVLSVEEMTQLIEAVGNKTPDMIRLLAMLELSYGSGLRASEL